MNLKRTLPAKLVIFIALSVLFGGYSQWNSANPDKTCANCHEISLSVDQWHTSAHRNIRCAECHGTAMSNGFHSLKEKANMVFTHMGKGKKHEEIRVTGNQVSDLSERCAKCHQSEYAKWQSGGHSASYADIFMNKKHNREETPYWACLRCHGMFYDGDIKTLLQKPESGGSEWRFTNLDIAPLPTIPCLSCHSIHAQNDVSGRPARLDHPQDISYMRPSRNSPVAWYIRDDKRFIRADKLMRIPMFNQGKGVRVADDPATKLCMQCHSPNFAHQTGSEDDRTPTGVHEGLGCMACHSPHSNDSRNSCKNCHPVISNCKLDFTKMNTTFADKNSQNNIHSVSCNSCHKDGEKLKALRLGKLN